MRKAEREMIEQAIRLLHTDDGFDDAMDILVRLAGRVRHAEKIRKLHTGVRTVDVCDLPIVNRKFEAPDAN